MKQDVDMFMSPFTQNLNQASGVLSKRSTSVLRENSENTDPTQVAGLKSTQFLNNDPHITHESDMDEQENEVENMHNVSSQADVKKGINS